MEGDIPWLEKLTNSIGHTAKRACFRCAQNGVWVFSANTVRCVVSASSHIPHLPVLAQTFTSNHSSPACRWLGHHRPLQQPAPCYVNGPLKGKTLTPEEEAAASTATPRMVAGSVQPDAGGIPPRTAWTEPQPVPPSSWMSDNRLKYSAAEIMARGRKGDKIAAQVQLRMLGPYSPFPDYCIDRSVATPSRCSPYCRQHDLKAV